MSVYGTGTYAQSRSVEQLQLNQYHNFIAGVSEALNAGNFKKVDQQLCDNLYLCGVIAAKQEIFDYLLETCLEQVQDPDRYAKAAQFARLLANHKVTTPYSKICEAACLFKLKNFRDADEKMKQLDEKDTTKMEKSIKVYLEYKPELVHLFQDLKDAILVQRGGFLF